MGDLDGYLPGEKDDIGWVLSIAWIAPALAAIYSIFSRDPTPPPPSSELKGCYVSSNGPSIRFDGRLMHIGRWYEPVPYRLAFAKYATIDLVTDAPIFLAPAGLGRYAFERGEQLTIVLGRLSHAVDEKVYGVAKVADATFITVLNLDGDDLVYTPADPASCSATPVAR